MGFLKKFIKLMKHEPKQKRKKRHVWTVDESKCLSIDEVNRLREFCEKLKDEGLEKRKFTKIRNWFMIELGLETGLRVNEMASLKHGSLFIDEVRSSIVVIGKGDKKRSVRINSDFKKKCLEYTEYKKNFGFDIESESYFLNNLRDTKISKRALQKFFKEIILKAGLPSRYYIHCLRHTYTTFLLQASKHNYKFAQDQLGHASIETTQVYAGIIESEGKKALECLYE
jgi:site-specific recombinase XerD